MATVREINISSSDFYVSRAHTEDRLIDFHVYETQYCFVPERAWGRMEADSSIPGLCTDNVDTCYVYIFHCAATSRTTLLHIVIPVDEQALFDQVNYVANGNQVDVDLTILKGNVHTEPQSTMSPALRKTMEDDMLWVQESIQRIRDFAEKVPVWMTITQHPRPLECGCALVEKTSGTITIPIDPQRLLNGRLLWCFAEPSTQEVFYKRRMMEIFLQAQSVTDLIASGYRGASYFLTYDDRNILPVPLPNNDMQELERYAAIHSRYPDLEPIMQNDLDNLMRLVPNREISHQVAGMAKVMVKVGWFCSKCRTIARKRCVKCKGAWYCCVEHQGDDWPKHKLWCKAHQYHPGGRAGLKVETEMR